ncbi:MAG TPA: serine/threonine-protein kinase, partial [Ktedonobacteraceae bacterium]|nr:serine/threonine-protein kinase [Ktedonobacteraceae bacterium]
MQLWRYGRPLEYLGQRYRLDGMLGSGGMADVCLAWDEREQRQVALKILKSDDLDQETLNRFMKEAAQIAHWQHPHILRIYEQLQVELLDASTGAVLFYMVSEYARGGDLQKRLTAGRPFPLAATFALFRQLCSAVQYAHERGVIHRDLKPLNMLFRRPATGPEELVLSDFGLAVQVDASHYTFARGGTLAYMAPEQLQGNAQPASDIFALGVILYVLCTGHLPFRRTLQDIPRIVQGQMPLPTRPALLNPELPSALDEVILRALRELPAERYGQPREFWEAIELALKTNARTLPFVASSDQSAGQTWPYDDGSEQPLRNHQAGRQGQPPAASSSLPGEDMAEVEEGSVSALWIAREKQKASPVRLPLPTHSILMSPNPADEDGLEQIAPAAAAPATWQSAHER